MKARQGKTWAVFHVKTPDNDLIRWFRRYCARRGMKLYRGIEVAIRTLKEHTEPWRS